MAFNYSKGPQVIGDLKAADDQQRDTKIDFEEDYIALHTSGSAILIVSGSKVAIGPQPHGVSSFPSYKLDVAGDIRIRGNDIRDNSGDPAITFDGSANTVVSGTLKVEDDMYVDVIRRQSDSSTTTKIRLMDEEVRIYAGNANDQVLKVESGNVEISGSLTAEGAVYKNVTVVTSFPYAVTNNDYVILVGGTESGRTVNLPSIVGQEGRVLIIKDKLRTAQTNNIRVSASAGTNQEIDGQTFRNFQNNGKTMTIIAGPDQWYRISEFESN